MRQLFILMAAFLTLALPKETQGIDIEGPYLSGTTGFNILDYHHKYQEKDFKLGWNLGFQIGYRFCNGIRTEGEINYRYNRIKAQRKENQKKCRAGGKVYTWAFMANGLYEIPVCLCFTPYIGAGIGYDAFEKEINQSTSRDKGVAWQAIGGALYQIDDNLEMGLQYTFHRIINNRYLNNTIDLKLNWFF